MVKFIRHESRKHSIAGSLGMNLIRYFITVFAAILAGLLLTTCCWEPHIPYIRASPSKLTFEADETDEQIVKIETNTSDWIQKVDAWWIDAIRKSDRDSIFVRVQDYNDINFSRIGTIEISTSLKGHNATTEIIVEQLKKQKNTLSVNPSLLLFEANETADKTVTVTTDAPIWDASTSVLWVQLAKQGSTLKVHVSPNSWPTERLTEIMITAGNAEPVTIKITQAATTMLVVNPTSLIFNYNSTTIQTVTVLTNAPSWEATTSASWINLNKSGITLSVNPTSQNLNPQYRSTFITVTAGDQERTVSILQSASVTY